MTIRRRIILLLTALLCLGACTTTGLSEGALEEIVMDPAFDITPLTQQLEMLQGNLLQKTKTFDPEDYTIIASVTEKNKYTRIFSDFVAGVPYIFTMGANQTLSGSPEAVRVRVHDFENKKNLLVKDLIADRDYPQAWIFTIPEDTDMANVQLIVYAGVTNKSWGNVIRYTDLGLYMWMPGISEMEIIQALSLVEIPETPPEEALLRYLNNPYTDITALLDAYAQRYPTDLLSSQAASYDPSRFILQAGKSARFQYQRLYDSLRVGESYLFNIESVAHLAGDAESITLRVYDFTTSATLLEMSLYANWDKPQTKIFTIPEGSADSDATISLLLYAGAVGETEGNTFAFTNAWLYPWDGIGDDAELIADLPRYDNTPVEPTEPGDAPTEAAANLLEDTLDDEVDIQASGSDGYASVCLYDDFTAGSTYTLSIDRLEMLTGDATDVTVRLLSAETQETVQRRTIAIADGSFEWTFSIARDVDAQSLELHVYAGIVGKTAGNHVRLYDVALYEGAAR